jgi:hypothetical protein
VAKCRARGPKKGQGGGKTGTNQKGEKAWSRDKGGWSGGSIGEEGVVRGRAEEQSLVGCSVGEEGGILEVRIYSTVVQERKVEYYRGGRRIREEGGVLEERVK